MIASEGFHEPRAATEPASLIVWPYCVVTSSSKVTAMEVGLVEQAEEVVVGFPDPETGFVSINVKGIYISTY